MDEDIEFVIANNGSVGIFLPPLDVRYTHFALDKPIIILKSNSYFSKINPPALFFNKAESNKRILLVECKDDSILKEYEIYLEL